MSEQTEHALEIDRYGGPEELVWRAVQRPPPGDDEVRIRTLYAAVNRADIEIRRGEWPIVRDDPFPTPPVEVVGVVDDVGARVTGVWPGAHVITMMQHLAGIWGERPGGYGEYVVVPADALATFAPEVDAEQMAALGLVGVKAAEGLARLDLQPGTSVVVHGASGGVGSAAVALACARGAVSAWDLIQELGLTGWSSENLTGDALREHVAQIAELVRGGLLIAPAIECFAMADAAQAYRRIEADELTGRALLVP